jgi:hypothetical protein
MANDKAKDILAELLQLQPYYNIATTNSDEPWNSPVWAAKDEHFNLYWSSWTQAVHSLNIAENSKVFMTLYDSTRERGTNNFRCLYLQCTAKEVVAPEEAQKAAYMLYPSETIDISDFFGHGLKRFYKATPVRAWLNCLSERQLTPETIKMRMELSLEDLRAAT